MKTTAYFERRLATRREIRLEWVERVLSAPLRRERQADGRIRMWGLVEETGKYLRVVVLPDGETVHNAFFDRRFREGQP